MRLSYVIKTSTTKVAVEGAHTEYKTRPSERLT
jgi:hypothetical protein